MPRITSFLSGNHDTQAISLEEAIELRRFNQWKEDHFSNLIDSKKKRSAQTFLWTRQKTC